MPQFGPTKATSRVILNRQAMSLLDLAVADGLTEVMQKTIQDARERAPFEEDRKRQTSAPQLRDTADWAVFNGTRKVAGTANKPRELRSPAGVISGVAGFGSPLAHLVERGTALRHTEHPSRFTGRGPAQPFLMPAIQGTAMPLGRAIGDAVRRRRLGVPT